MVPDTKYHSIVNYPPFTEQEMEVLGGYICQWCIITSGQVRWSPTCPSLKSRYFPTPTWSAGMHTADVCKFAILNPFCKILLDLASPPHKPFAKWNGGWFPLFSTYVPLPHEPFFWMGRGSSFSTLTSAFSLPYTLGVDIWVRKG